ncbi:hypothetical protein ABZ424_19785 [Streptomyces sp. NPDC005790]|uniref:hypothetical protein n=1 Tax=Streptomyces sp. NPDC005790 TaxID=3154777 RepID=UPI0033F70333
MVDERDERMMTEGLLSGVLDPDPYTGTRIAFVRSRSKVDIGGRRPDLPCTDREVSGSLAHGHAVYVEPNVRVRHRVV